MSNAFERAITFVLAEEGGYVNDSRDAGGETKYGISKRAYPHLNIATLTEQAAAGIYRRDYWAAVRGDDLPPAVALVTFDAAVNSGVRAATLWLQQAVRERADGDLGPKTLAAARLMPQRQTVVDCLARRCAERVGPGGRNDVFDLGWSRRLFRLALAASPMMED